MNPGSPAAVADTRAVALIAHDDKKDDLVEFVRGELGLFQQYPLVATGSTGQRLASDLGLAVECVAHGPHGGDLIIGGRVAQGHIRAVIFLRDPLTAQPHEPDVSALMRVCDVHHIPLATNLGTARAVVAAIRTAGEAAGRDRSSLA